MNRNLITFVFFSLLCVPLLPLAAAHAETAQSFLLTADKPVKNTMTVTMSGKNITDLYGYEVRIAFDSDQLELVAVKSGLDGYSIDPIIKTNEIIFAHTKIGNVTGASGDILIGTLTFKSRKYGTSSVKWESIKTVDHNLADQTFSVGKSVSLTSAKKSFVDLEGHWAKADIELLASKGIIEGMDDEHFGPQAHITRSQFTALISRALDLKGNTNKHPFADVASNSWYAIDVNRAYSAGIIQGMTATSFAPDNNITREEMAVMIVRAGAYISSSAMEESQNVVLPFADSEAISEWARENLYTAVHSGIIKGRAENKFAPQDQANRAEAAAVITRLLAVLSLI